MSARSDAMNEQSPQMSECRSSIIVRLSSSLSTILVMTLFVLISATINYPVLKSAGSYAVRT